LLEIDLSKALKSQRTKRTAKERIRLYLRIKTNYYTSAKEGIRLKKIFCSSAAVIYQLEQIVNSPNKETLSEALLCH
jgi:hypothetical protein